MDGALRSIPQMGNEPAGDGAPYLTSRSAAT